MNDAKGNSYKSRRLTFISTTLKKFSSVSFNNPLKENRNFQLLTPLESLTRHLPEIFLKKEFNEYTIKNDENSSVFLFVAFFSSSFRIISEQCLIRWDYLILFFCKIFTRNNKSILFTLFHEIKLWGYSILNQN